jgi:hypothetical protein
VQAASIKKRKQLGEHWVKGPDGELRPTYEKRALTSSKIGTEVWYHIGNGMAKSKYVKLVRSGKMAESYPGDVPAMKGRRRKHKKGGKGKAVAIEDEDEDDENDNEEGGNVEDEDEDDENDNEEGRNVEDEGEDEEAIFVRGQRRTNVRSVIAVSTGDGDD